MKFSFERAKAPGTTNKAKKAVFDNISRDRHARPADGDRRAEQRRRQPPLPHGREHGRDPRAEERRRRPRRKPVGTGPYKFDSWAKGSTVTLAKWDGYRDAAKVR